MVKRHGKRPRIVRVDEIVSHGNFGPGREGEFTPEMSDLLMDEQNIERDRAIPEPSAIVRVRNEEGQELWMAPHPPPPTRILQTVLVKKVHSKDFYIYGLIICALSLIAITIFQIYAWVLTKYYWPLYFFTSVIDRQVGSEGFARILENYAGFILSIHPLLMGTWILISTFFFKKAVLKAYFTRSVYFCVINLFFIIVAIIFVSSIPTTYVIEILKNHIDRYDLSNDSEGHKGWDRLQQYEKCCGVRGFEDWTSQRQSRDVIFKIPASCCIVFRLDFLNGVVVTPDGYLEDIDECQKKVGMTVIWQDGCLHNFLVFLEKFCATFAFIQLLTIVFVTISTTCARKYFIMLQNEAGNSEFDYTMGEACIHIFCLGYCIKYVKDVDTGKYVIIGRHDKHPHSRKFDLTNNKSDIQIPATARPPAAGEHEHYDNERVASRLSLIEPEQQKTES